MYTRQLGTVHYFSTVCHRIKIVIFVSFYSIMHIVLLPGSVLSLKDPRFHCTFLLTLNFDVFYYIIVLFSIRQHYFLYEKFYLISMHFLHSFSLFHYIISCNLWTLISPCGPFLLSWLLFLLDMSFVVFPPMLPECCCRTLKMKVD